MKAQLLTAVYLALLTAPFLSAVAVAPVVVVSYKRTRTVHVTRCLYLYLFVFFALCAWFMTMLPFPDRASVAAMTGPVAQLVPGYCVWDFVTNSSLDVSDWTTIFPALTGNIALGVILNVVLLVPSGFFFRALYAGSARRAVLVGFCISLFFELVQLSGLFFIYPRPYRIFDVDDLVQNTLGFWLGFALQPLPGSLLRSPRKPIVLRHGGEVRMRRRAVSVAVDQVILLALALGCCLVTPRWHELRFSLQVPILFLYHVGWLLALSTVTYFAGGRSPGMMMTGLRLRRRFGGQLSWRACVARSAAQEFQLTLPVWIAIFLELSDRRRGLTRVVCSFFSAACVFLYLYFLLTLLLYVITHGEPLFCDKLTRTRLVENDLRT